jgi:hypothetical protein
MCRQRNDAQPGPWVGIEHEYASRIVATRSQWVDVAHDPVPALLRMTGSVLDSRNTILRTGHYAPPALACEPRL